MAASLQFNIAAKLDAAGFKDAAAAVRSMGEEAGKAKVANEDMGGSVDLLRSAYGLLISYGIVEFFKKVIDVSIDAEIAQRRLGATVDNAGIKWKEAGGKVNAFLDDLAKKSVFSKTELTSAFADMTEKTNDVSVSMKFFKDAMGLAYEKTIPLSQAANLVALAAEHSTRGVAGLGRMLGFMHATAKDSEIVLKTLEERFGSAALHAEGFGDNLEKMSNRGRSSMVSLGNAIAGAINPTLNLAEKIHQAADKAGVDYDQMFQSIDTTSKRLGKSNEEVVDKIIKGFDAQDKAMQKHIANQNEDLKNHNNKLKEATISDENLLAEFNAKAISTEEGSEKRKIALLDAQHKKRMEMLNEFFIEEHTNDKVRDNIMKAEKAAYENEVLNIKKAGFKKAEELTFKSFQQIGVGLGKSLTGQQDAWKGSIDTIIDMVANEAQAVVSMKSIEGGFNEIAKFGWAGVPSALGLIALGATEAAAIAGIASAAKSMTGSSSAGATSAGTAISSSPMASSGAGATVSSPSSSGGQGNGTTLIVNVQGDYIGDTAFVDRLAEKLSIAVENRDVRLVAKQVSV